MKTMQDNKVHQTLLMDELSKFRYDLQISNSGIKIYI